MTDGDRESQVLEALRDEQQKALPTASGHPERMTYTYTDEQFVPLYEVIRHYVDGKKKFSQRPAGGGKGRDGFGIMKGVRYVLYRLPEVIEAIKSGDTIYVVEGEKDADALAALGIPATCNPMGANDWKQAYTDTLKGGHVVVVADRDAPGRKHAHAVAASLARVAASVQVAEAAKGNDASDHLAAGFGVSEFVVIGRQLDLAEAGTPKSAPRPLQRGDRDDFDRFLSRVGDARSVGDGQWSARCPAHDDRNPSLTFTRGDGGKLVVHCHAGCSFEAIVRSVGLWRDGASTKPKPPLLRPAGAPVLVHHHQVTAKPVEWLWHPRIPKGKVTIFDGDPGVGKSTICCDITARVTTGEPWPDDLDANPREPGSVLWLSAEDADDDTLVPRLLAAGADITRSATLRGAIRVEDDAHYEDELSLPSDIATLETAVRELGADLVIVDVLVAYLDDHINSNSDKQVRRALRPLGVLAERTGTAVVALRHFK